MVKTTGNSLEVITGKWMVGIGLCIGLFFIGLVYLTKNEPTHPVVAHVGQGVTITAAALNPNVLAAVTLDVLGQQITFTSPRDYCTLGNSDREVELMAASKRAMGEETRLLYVAALCTELSEYKKGHRELLDHWLQIQLIGTKGKFQRIEMAREVFLSSISKSSPRVDIAEINRRVNASFENPTNSVSKVVIEPLGRDGNAVYFSIQLNVNTDYTSRPVKGIIGMTLLNSLPLSINVYESFDSTKNYSQLQFVQQELLNSLLNEN
jgi:hypothetical protein